MDILSYIMSRKYTDKQLPVVTDNTQTYHLLDASDIDATLAVEGKAADAKATGKAIAELTEDKADKAYMVSLFEELKTLILNGDTSGAVALLDQAILDQSVLA